jgi:hypothetical protein
MNNNKKLDYQWNLIWNGKLKQYQLTESRLVDGVWLTMNTSTWETMGAALEHISVTNDQRRREVV